MVILPDGRSEHFWIVDAVPSSAKTTAQQECLARAIYFEARSEPLLGQWAVAQVIINRLKSPAFPDTICDIVYQNQDWRDRCQFSFACDGIPDQIFDRRAWRTAQSIAHDALHERYDLLSGVGSATHYHATYVTPPWATGMRRTEQIGLHIFYKSETGGWG